jgi:hypothetical protein
MVNDSVCDRAKRTVTAIELVACHAFRHIAHILSLNMHTYTQAIQIFEAKADREVRDTLAASVAARFGITAKAVRDIWNLRTWVQTTEPYWTPADHAHFLTKRPPRLCEECKARNVSSRSAACQRCAGPPRRGRPAIQRTFLFETAAQVEEEEEQAVVAGAGAIMSEAGAHSATAIDESLGVRPDPRVCAAVNDVLAASAWTGEPPLASPFFPMLDVFEESACKETPAMMLSCQENASACGDNAIGRWMESDDEEEDACWGTGAEVLSRQGAVLARDVGDLVLQSNDNEDDEVAFCGTEKDDEVAFGATMLAHHQALLAYEDGDGVLPYNEELEIVL